MKGLTDSVLIPGSLPRNREGRFVVGCVFRVGVRPRILLFFQRSPEFDGIGIGIDALVEQKASAYQARVCEWLAPLKEAFAFEYRGHRLFDPCHPRRRQIFGLSTEKQESLPAFLYSQLHRSD
jgi:hypothetical protein